eukprot:1195683-Prorocentrum_minimum.AAC.2
MCVKGLLRTFPLRSTDSPKKPPLVPPTFRPSAWYCRREHICQRSGRASLSICSRARVRNQQIDSSYTSISVNAKLCGGAVANLLSRKGATACHHCDMMTHSWAADPS